MCPFPIFVWFFSWKHSSLWYNFAISIICYKIWATGWQICDPFTIIPKYSSQIFHHNFIRVHKLVTPVVWILVYTLDIGCCDNITTFAARVVRCEGRRETPNCDVSRLLHVGGEYGLSCNTSSLPNSSEQCLFITSSKACKFQVWLLKVGRN